MFTTLCMIILIGVNASVLSESQEEISAQNSVEATEGAYCYTFDWTMQFMGTGFGCGPSTSWCSDIIDDVNCVIYRFSGDPIIVIEN